MKFELDILAYHWLRSGDVTRGCELLQNAALKALDMGALKEAVNSLSQAVAYGKQHSSRPYWIALLGFAKNQFGDYVQAEQLMYQAMKELGDKNLMPQKRSQLALDKMKREYGEFDDVPKSVDGKIDDLDRARLLIAFKMIEAVTNRYGIKDTIMKDYDLAEEDLQSISEWYTFYALIASYKQNNPNLWLWIHYRWPIANNGHLVQTNPDLARRIYRRPQFCVNNLALNRIQGERTEKCILLACCYSSGVC